eukprot:14416748-Alexandrium_andersonii.AAC.1
MRSLCQVCLAVVLLSSLSPNGAQLRHLGSWPQVSFLPGSTALAAKVRDGQRSAAASAPSAARGLALPCA